ncbi:hypothetical protein Sros_3543 [Streptosporangium roseum DSM 43021]|uniref:Uncharacterized protein n=1 Tax=Streptosporangium roseum (strain ATCC 12428 / DSM 43021 / JCM 3005 / KCTC 9067 / NCIMB 10171 / NRRL 2505 / NI 9100) TaxID=479432 RepID=D2AQT2_STRRD|nr:hypothetical protein Sros_3543 [Streptosporangium roseum DSM 43021]
MPDVMRERAGVPAPMYGPAGPRVVQGRTCDEP